VEDINERFSLEVANSIIIVVGILKQEEQNYIVKILKSLEKVP
jgi:hypothetical protein